jgi:hypothetical protein
MVAIKSGEKENKMAKAIGSFLAIYVMAVVAWIVFYTSQSIALKILSWIAV